MTYKEMAWHTRKLSEKLREESEARLRNATKVMQKAEAQKQRMVRVKRS